MWVCERKIGLDIDSGTSVLILYLIFITYLFACWRDRDKQKMVGCRERVSTPFAGFETPFPHGQQRGNHLSHHCCFLQ